MEPSCDWQVSMSNLIGQRFALQDQLVAMQRRRTRVAESQQVINFACNTTPFAMAEYDTTFETALEQAHSALFQRAAILAAEKKPAQEVTIIMFYKIVLQTFYCSSGT